MLELYTLRVTRRTRLIDVVALSFSRRKAKRIIDEGLCSVNVRKETKYRRELRPGDTVRFALNPYMFQSVDASVLYEDEYFCAVQKPPFINTNVDSPNLESVLRKKLGENLWAVHRLDKHTSGVLLFAKSREVFDRFKEIFRKRLVRKHYLVVVQGILEGEKRIAVPLDGREALTVCRGVRSLSGASFVEVEIETGRKHQIRRHLVGLGYPVVGEFLYWKRGWRNVDLLYAPRILLHASSIEFPHPVEGDEIRVEAPLLEDFREFLLFLEGEELPARNLVF